MKCSKCGSDLTENIKFCPFCGERIESETPASVETVTQAGSTSSTEKKSSADKFKDKVITLWKKLSAYGKIATIVLAIFTLLCLIAFLAGKTFAGIIAILSLALVIVALLIKKEVIKTHMRWLHIVALILAVVLIVPYFGAFRTTRTSPDIDLDTTIASFASGVDNTESENTEDNNTEVESQKYTTTDYIIDYSDAKSFEKALNDGAKVNGKIVQFEVVEYKPDSALGINCWSGEHLNFISEEELDVGKGSIIVGRITKDPTKTLGSWEIHYEVLSIGGEKVEIDTTTPVDSEKNSEITMTMGEDDFKGMNYKEAEKIFREMGFTAFEYETLETDDINEPDDTIGAVEIKNWEYGKGNFAVGDTFESDAIVVLWYYVCDEPEPNLTVDNCPELAEILTNKSEIDELYSSFATKNKGRIIEFDGRIDYCTKHGDYKTRYDYLVSAGDYNPDHQIGPSFKFEDVNYFDLNTDLGTVNIGQNVHIVAKVVSFDSNTGIFYLDPVAVTGR